MSEENKQESEKEPVTLKEEVKEEVSQQKLPEKDVSIVLPPATQVTTPKVNKSSKRRHIPKGQVHILCTYNNTIISMSDNSGNSLGWSSSGSIGFRGAKKSTPFAATLVTQKVIEKTARYGVKEVDVFVKGVGGGREASVRALIAAGIQVNGIKDITPVPHNGCRPKKPRRV